VDDALHVHRRADGRVEVGVHIADVRWVRPHNPCWQGAGRQSHCLGGEECSGWSTSLVGVVS